MFDLSHFGPFRGDDMNPIQLDGVLAYGFNRSDIEASRSLLAKRWFDYRRLHPGQAFFLFAHHYKETAEAWRTRFGVSQWAKMSASEHPIWRTTRKGRVKELTLSPQVYRTTLWRCMCFADEHGIPYDHWIQSSFEYAFENNWQRMPGPGHLTAFRFVEAANARFDHQSAELMILPKDPFFRAENYIRHPHQEEFQTWLCGKIAKRPRPEFTLNHYLLKEPLLVQTIAERELGSEILHRATHL